MRALTELEEMNTEYLDKKGIQYVLVCLTQNILHHGIFDAKVALRELLQNTGVHDYSTQQPGEKISIDTHILTFQKNIEASSSMYRAGTRGDARMWFGSEIYDVAQPNDIFAIIPQEGIIYVLPISHMDVEYCCSTSLQNPVKTFFFNYSKK
ncbi:MAG: hypothetical protein J6Y61_04890 [Bacteroidales bacterium]|nr:hypothetical protein [Bacteroidales bacterium]